MQKRGHKDFFRMIAAAACCVLIISTGCTRKPADPANVTGTEAPTAAPTAEVTAAPTDEPATASPADNAPDATDPAGDDSDRPQTPELSDPEMIEIYVDPEWCSEWCEEKGVSYGYYEYDLPYLNEGYLEKYPELAKSFERFAAERKKGEQYWSNMIIESAKADNNYGEYYAKDILTAVRADSSLVCLRCENTSLVGCEWGYKNSSFCFDPNTGEELNLKDLVTDKQSFVDYVYGYAVEHATSLSDRDALKAYIGDAFDADTLCFEVGYNYLAVFFNPYEIESNFGSMTVPIPFNGYSGLFDRRCTASVRNYTISMSGANTLLTDLGNDGLVDEFEIWENSNPEGNSDDFETIAIYVNGYSDIVLECPCVCYDLNATYIHVNDEDFLYITYWYDSSDSDTFVYRIDTLASGYKPESWQNPFADVVQVGEEWDVFRRCSYDPMSIELEARVDIIGTSYVKNRFCIDENGAAHPNDGVYDFLNQWTLAAKKNFDVKRISKETGEELGELTVLYEEPVILAYTDREAYIDFLTEKDDTILLRLPIECVKYDYGDWIYREYRPVGEENFEELFMGIGYAD